MGRLSGKAAIRIVTINHPTMQERPINQRQDKGNTPEDFRGNIVISAAHSALTTSSALSPRRIVGFVKRGVVNVMSVAWLRSSPRSSGYSDQTASCF